MTESFAAGRDGTRLYVRYRPALGTSEKVSREDAGASTGNAGGVKPLPVALLSDGIACDGFIWKYLWEDLARTLPVAHWHYRGHGRSAPPADPTRIELSDLADDLNAVRLSLGDPDVVLFGHSMGCQVAFEAYRLRPEKVRALVLVCGSSGRITHTFKGTNVMAQWLPDVIAQVDAHPEIARALWGHVPPEIALQIALRTGEVDTQAIAPADLMPYMKHMVDIDPPMFLRMLRSAGEHSAADLLPKIEIPALVIAGDRDTFTPPRYAEEMAAAMPHAELMMAQGGTHVVPLERKAEVAARIETFLRQHVV